MSRIFGWDYPPGCSGTPWDRPDPPCEVCGQTEDDCVCPECPVCQHIGEPHCYDGDEFPSVGVKVASHGLVRSFAQVALLAEAERLWAEDAEEMERRYEDAAERGY